MAADKEKFQLWLTRTAQRIRARRRQERYSYARMFEEFYVPFDAKPVSPESAEIVARMLGEIRMSWRREERAL
jgi:hypothetical protein